MAVIDKTVIVNVPIEQVHAFLNDIKQFPEWYAGIDEVHPEPGFPTEVGSTSKFTYSVLNTSMEGELTITKNVPLEERHIKMDGMITGHQKWTFTSEGGSTRVHMYSEYQMSAGLLGKIVDKLVVERLNDKYAEESLAAMKSRIET